MSHDVTSRRLFLAVAAAGAGLFRFETSIKLAAMLAPRYKEPDFEQLETEPPHYTLRIASSPVEIAAKRIVSPTSYKALRANISETGLVLLINEQKGEKAEIRDEREISWCCSFPWGFGCRGTKRRLASWRAAAQWVR